MTNNIKAAEKAVTDLTAVKSWYSEDPDWNSATDYTKSEVHGDLATRVRRAFNMPVDEPVFIIEQTTQFNLDATVESYLSCTITCGKHSKEFDETWNNLVVLLDWLDEKAPNN